MKVGDKVYVELEIEKIDESDNTFKGKLTNGISYWVKNEVITQLPIQEGRWMMVSENKNQWFKRKVFMQKNNKFIAWNFAKDEEAVLLVTNTTAWKYAKEIPTKRIITLEQVATLMGISIDELEFEKIK